MPITDALTARTWSNFECIVASATGLGPYSKEQISLVTQLSFSARSALLTFGMFLKVLILCFFFSLRFNRLSPPVRAHDAAVRRGSLESPAIICRNLSRLPKGQ